MDAPEPAAQPPAPQSVAQGAGSREDRGDVEIVAVFARGEFEIIDAPREPAFMRNQLTVEQLQCGPHAPTGHQAPAFVMIISGIVTTAMTLMMTR